MAWVNCVILVFRWLGKGKPFVSGWYVASSFSDCGVFPKAGAGVS